LKLAIVPSRSNMTALMLIDVTLSFLAKVKRVHQFLYG